jgi:hypothetical protein
MHPIRLSKATSLRSMAGRSGRRIGLIERHRLPFSQWRPNVNTSRADSGTATATQSTFCPPV